MKLRCPECNSSKVLVEEVHTFWRNSLEHYCHSVKAHDEDAKVRCYKCEWTGTNAQLVRAKKETK